MMVALPVQVDSQVAVDQPPAPSRKAMAPACPPESSSMGCLWRPSAARSLPDLDLLRPPSRARRALPEARRAPAGRRAAPARARGAQGAAMQQPATQRPARLQTEA